VLADNWPTEVKEDDKQPEEEKAVEETSAETETSGGEEGEEASTPSTEGETTESTTTETKPVEIETKPIKEKQYIYVPYEKTQLVTLTVTPKSSHGFTAQDFANSRKRYVRVVHKCITLI